MELTFAQLIELTKGISLSGAVVILGYFCYKTVLPALGRFIDSKVNATPNQISAVQESIDTLNGNHVHELRDSLERIEAQLSKLNDNVIYIKTKINGRE